MSCCSQPPLPLVFEMGSHWTQDLLITLGWSAASPRNPPVLTSRASGLELRSSGLYGRHCIDGTISPDQETDEFQGVSQSSSRKQTGQGPIQSKVTSKDLWVFLGQGA